MGLEERKEGFFDKRLETASAEERNDRLSRKLNEFVEHVYDRSKAFRARLDERGTLDAQR